MTSTVIPRSPSSGLRASAFSHAVKKIELQLGAPIREREGRSLRLTLADEYADRMPVVSVKLGKHGKGKQFFFGMRDTDASIEYPGSFVEMAGGSHWRAPQMRRRGCAAG